jgi:aerobic-type carbon monoxide dehydrogenase small subunit (CoxS/CutS family)
MNGVPVPPAVRNPVKQELLITVNDHAHRLEIEPTRLLIDVLRDDLHLKGTKEGCGIGVCGACTVLVDDDVMSACLTLAVTVRDHHIRNIEGLATDGQLHPIQRAFLEHGGFQCGFCNTRPDCGRLRASGSSSGPL